LKVRRSLGLLVALMVALGAIGCRSGKEGSPFSRGGNRTVEVRVENNQFLNVTVYAEAAGASHRLGEVTGKSSGTFTVNPKQVSMSTGLQLRVDPIGSNRNYISPIVYPDGGGVVVLTVAAELYMSYVTLR
jgi:hypothetical protein